MTDSADKEPSPRPKAYIVDTSASPEAVLRGVPVDAVRWTNGFWGQRYQQTCKTSVHVLWDLLADADAGHVLQNFRIAAGRMAGEHEGTDWQDAWMYKWIESAASLYRPTGDAWLAERMDECIELIADAQQDDGYIATQMTIPGRERYQEPRNHEVYSMGHLLTAAVTHRRMTGKKAFLEIAVGVGDHLCEVLGVTVDPAFAHNPSAIMGLVELYRETGEKRYLKCAQTIVDQRGHKPREGWLFSQTTGVLGTDQIQDRVPIRQEQQVVGHNVFFTYLFTGAADVLLETEDTALREALERLWTDLMGRKINVNGGVSPMGVGLSRSRDPVCEAVGAPYFLPNADAYNETCGQIGHLMWNYRMLCRTGAARFADAMELEIYNGILSGIGAEGDTWWYRNALRRHESAQGSSAHNDHPERGQPGRRSICCPTNLLRTVAQWQGYVYGVSGDSVWVHQYGANTAALALPDGGEIELKQVTDYPWDGKIALEVKAAPTRELALRLRIPGWAEGATIAINGNAHHGILAPGTYVCLEHLWSVGDVVELVLPMPARLMQAHPKVEQCRGQAAIFRGPILYCLESVDLPEGVDIWNVQIPSDIALTALPAKEFPFDAQCLEGDAVQRAEPGWGDFELYRPIQDRPIEPVPLRLIPYFAWANRGPSGMSVWLPALLRG
ncbi:MAG: glycoside hydrolase family 127 protein [Lentisphaerae bacterium]|nr:glycoside hydrolase family 127 protein [Lentisphaerota bacterium]MBT4817346.1 glycoside hydrolase family 127 protein [Lentisphaerota bacterium]MBT5612955.1 glycoside hydrolase family 127 protein [Lentisphaerota bacterium]MBT7059033.1 glycoside hydrolase family 127 protein [Lentisphaerota bacterium]MBT7846420.1 glycoside hydrolase family 127 protein [Lentisphaerota bacterium]